MMEATHDIGAMIRRLVLEESKRAHVGHIGSALSIADLVGVLFADALRDNRGHADRDRFLLGKGHAVLAVYAALHATGRLSRDELTTFCGDASKLNVHPEAVLDGIDFSTGSLGHALSLGAGAALAARMQGSSRRTFVLVSDAECNEGSLWEAVMFAAQHQLSNLVAIVDLNGQQALGYTREVLDLTPMSERWASFGWDVVTVDGHDPAAIRAAIDEFDLASGPPHVMVAETTFGKGVSYMESQIKWHYLPMSDEEYEQALAEVGG